MHFVHKIISNDNNLALNFGVAVFYVLCINFFTSTVCVSVTISGILRLVSLVKVSEEAGLQLLGPDNVAVVIIRFASILISAFLPSFAIYNFEAYPLLLGLFYGVENRSNFEDIQRNIFSLLYLVLPSLAVFVGLADSCTQILPRNPSKILSEFLLFINLAPRHLLQNLSIYFH